MIYINKDQPVVVTGAKGRIGRRVVPFLKEEFPLRLLDLQPGEIDGLPVDTADILDLDQVLKGCANSSAIVHFAIADYSNHNDHSPEDVKADYRLRMIDVNIRGAYHIYEAARILGIPKVIFISSLTAALGDTTPGAQLSPKLAPRPVNFYACTKIFGEYTGEVYFKHYGIKSYSLRLGQPYPFSPPDMPYPESLRQLEQRWVQDPVSASHMVTMADIARAISAGLKAQSPGYGTYNVVSASYPEHTDFTDGQEIGFMPKDVIKPDGSIE